MSVSVADVTVIVEARKTLSDAELAKLTTLILMAGQRFEEAAFRDFYNEAVALLVLHWLAKSARADGVVGAITSEREGDLARSYAAPVGMGGFGTDDLLSTSWGVELKNLINACIITPTVWAAL